MLCDPSSRPQSPFLRPSPTPHMHHHPTFYPTPPQAPSRIFPSSSSSAYPTPSSSGPSQPTPIPSTPSTSDQQQQSSFHPCQSLSVPPTPSTSSPRPTIPHSQSQSQRIPHSSASYTRPKPLKKSSGSTNQKQKNVQMSLELKVEKAKGFHAFFVPLCKNLPPPPPCSPVNGHSPLSPQHNQTQGQGQMNGDYFGQWNKARSHDTWVEDVGNSLARHGGNGGDGMEVDAQ
ncbi:hypothetical protein I302_106665 [Kwoniella bestiolae CBS 10118]|uniref:Uncharacterized protein n=1 Tax=Kwoniella bestiolae CBS 10118 TaxID=1296100 RepID=A0A1B9G0R4_9TREE|nr:hypothetical protein I302_06073 [Kwoniella bestiolae CBS 10118]OCF24612.1 hypothetical protein I302_06073 [Kwoniella bestiolae CBS 10118]